MRQTTDSAKAEMRRADRLVTERSHIDAIIRRSRVCRLGLVWQGEPYVVPLCFGYDGDAVYLHMATAGKKLCSQCEQLSTRQECVMRCLQAILCSTIFLLFLTGCIAEPVSETPQIVQLVVERTVEVTREVIRETTREVTRQVTVVMVATTSPTQVPTPSRIVSPTRLPTSTPTISPTATSTPIATNTPRPTVTPAPTSAQISPEVRKYASLIADSVMALLSEMSDLSELLSAPKLYDGKWRSDVDWCIMIIQLIHQEVLETYAPVPMRDIHAMLLLATADYSSAMDYLSVGLDYMDSDAIDEAVRLMESGGAKIRETNERLEEYMAQFD